MSKFKVGDKVRFTDNYLYEHYPSRFPEAGTIGIIRSFAEWPIVEWPFGSIYGNDVQKCPCIYLELAETAPDTAQQAKRDADKPRPSLVPSQIIWDIAEVREYGNAKYGDPDNWRQVELHRYIDALYRHMLAFVADPASTDDESGLRHYKHMACNMAFICDMMARDNK